MTVELIAMSQFVSAVKLNWCTDRRVNCYISQFVSAVKLNWCNDCRVNCYESICESSENELV